MHAALIPTCTAVQLDGLQLRAARRQPWTPMLVPSCSCCSGAHPIFNFQFHFTEIYKLRLSPWSVPNQHRHPGLCPTSTATTAPAWPRLTPASWPQCSSSTFFQFSLARQHLVMTPDRKQRSPAAQLSGVEHVCMSHICDASKSRVPYAHAGTCARTASHWASLPFSLARCSACLPACLPLVTRPGVFLHGMSRGRGALKAGPPSVPVPPCKHAQPVATKGARLGGWCAWWHACMG